MLDLSPHLREHLPAGDPFGALMAMEGEVFREVAGRRTVGFALGGRRYFVKVHRGPGWREVFKELSQGRLPVLGAMREWRGAERLGELGVKTFKVVGKGCRGANPVRLESFVVTEALEGMINLEELAPRLGELEPARRVALVRELTLRLAEVARRVHGGGLNHRDFYLCHFLTPDRDWSRWAPGEGAPLELTLIDLHRVQLRRKVPERWLVKDLGGLLFSAWDCGLTDRDLLRFVEVYRGRHWREVLRSEAPFWGKVVRRAVRLYRPFHGRPPPRGGLLANWP